MVEHAARSLFTAVHLGCEMLRISATQWTLKTRLVTEDDGYAFLRRVGQANASYSFPLRARPRLSIKKVAASEADLFGLPLRTVPVEDWNSGWLPK
jgi:hypothetical protein